jgi:hypothetical protein
MNDLLFFSFSSAISSLCMSVTLSQTTIGSDFFHDDHRCLAAIYRLNFMRRLADGPNHNCSIGRLVGLGSVYCRFDIPVVVYAEMSS